MKDIYRNSNINGIENVNNTPHILKGEVKNIHLAQFWGSELFAWFSLVSSWLFL